jgi:hypothetical protein
LLVCAHPWEARPFQAACCLEPVSAGYLPYVCYQGEWNRVAVNLLVTGSGRSRSAQAVGAWLSHSLRDSGHGAGAGLQAPPLVVANFGTAGAYYQTWSVGQTLLVNRVRLGEGPAGESLYPERLAPWAGEEAECRTVPLPQTSAVEADRVGLGRQPVFDMEAFGVAEATATFLSMSHLVVGKCISDEIPDRNDPVCGQPFDWKALAQRCQAQYDSGAVAFLEHAIAHLNALESNSRRKQSVAIKGTVDALVATAQAALPLTVSQQRDLAQHLRARLAACGEAQTEHVASELAALILASPARDKSSAKKLLADLVSQIRAQL